jgi:tubby and related proteins
VRRSYVEDDDDDEGIHTRRGHQSRHSRDVSDEEDQVHSHRQSRQPARAQPKERPPRRAYDDESGDEDEYRPRDGPSNRRQENDEDDSYERHNDRKEHRQQPRPGSRDSKPSGRRNSRSPDDDNVPSDQDERGHPSRGMVRRGSSREQDNPMERRQSLRTGYWSPENNGRRPDAQSADRQAAEPVFVPVPLNLTNMRAFLTSPVPKSAGVVQCYIRRYKPATALYPTYNLYLKDGDRFLLTSKKRLNNKTSNYLISMVYNEHNRDSNSYLGKVRSNFVGTEFQIYDHGINPEKVATADEPVRKDLGAVMYAANILGTRGPRKMQVALPAVDENDRILSWNASKDGSHDDMLNRIKDRNFRDLVYLINKPPRWNEQVGAYVLNFNGRVTMASVKNFQLVDPDEQNTVVLQFGRVSKDEFSMDMQWPVSPLQAFAITMTSFDSKIACD